MSIVRNRELSQFGSFVYIDNNSREIGIATESTPFVGIGTANPTVKFEVVGDTNINGYLRVIGGTIDASFYTLNGSPLVNANVEYWTIAGTNDLYRDIGNVGIGTSVFAEKLTVDGNVSAGRFISTVTSGSPLSVSSADLVSNLNADFLRGRTPPVGDFVGTTDSQTLTNKIFGTNTRFSGSTSGVTTLSASSVASGVLELPANTGTLISTGSVGIITSGLIADNTITNADINSSAAIAYSKLNLSNSIVNADVAVGAGITYGKLNLSNSIANADISSSAAIAISKLAASTISGISLGNNLNTLTFGSYLTGNSYNGSAARTISVNASTSGTSNIVARDSSGNFSAGTITATLNGIASQTPYWNNSTYGVNEIKAGTGDGASFTTYNMVIRSWWGIGFRDFTDSSTVKLYINCRTGDISSSGTITANSIVKTGGTSSQFLKADGSVDSTVFVSAGRAVALSLVFGG